MTAKHRNRIGTGRPRRGARRRAAALVIAAGLIVGAVPARAEEADFTADVLRLAEILGALTHLDGLCGGGDGAVWRAKMQALIDAETPQPDMRRRYVDVFNRANRTYAALYLGCTDRARAAIDRLLGEGGEVTGRLAGE